MMKTRMEKVIAAGGVCLLVGGFLMCCSGIQFPFFNAKSSLNGHLQSDLGVSLPGSTAVSESYWIGMRDPEHVFKTQMAPADLVPFMAAVHTAAKARGYEESVPATEWEVSHFGPLYRPPPWWNNPPLGDAVPLEILIKREDVVATHYRFLYSPSAGTMYVVWGGF